ncbi:LysR family transcriptional regulator [Streptomyces griseomycini]|uniref:LysR substrate-binding domain-containing protein n=1 Tax=Streptomyces griseomycini TaxID=66895 RepID=UPI0018762D25|nr:LysR family transcriptional regulator [Streptomyces griseomycini]GGQ08469.1 LysR family transcriptional regulator [Streptomyces griseomycini]
MELRDIEIFLTLAEELHFGRTAERLHITQARVSQAIAKQERHIGAALFERTSRHVALTGIGARLREDLAAGYERIRAGVAAATEAARGASGGLVLGTMGALAHDIADVTGLFRARHPACVLSFREMHGSDPFGPLRREEVDLAVLWLPVREPDLTVGPVLRSRPLVMMAGASHPLAGRESVEMEDLGDHLVTRPHDGAPIPAYHLEAMLPARTPSGRPVRRGGPPVTVWQECLAVVASGEVVTPIQAEAAHYYPWPDIVYLPIRDAPLGEWALVWRTAGATPLVRAFVSAAEDALAERPADLPPGAASRSRRDAGRRGGRTRSGRVRTVGVRTEPVPIDKPGVMDRSRTRR